MLTLALAALIAAPGPVTDIPAWTRPLSRPLITFAGEYPQNTCDILHYDLTLEIFRETSTIEGITGILLTSPGGAVSDIRLDLIDLVVDSVWDATGPLTFNQDADSVFITLSSPVSPSDTTEIFIEYGGTPYHEAWGGFWFHPYVTYQMGVGVYSANPSMGQCMFPCWDHPNDKAEFDFHITVPDSLYCVANGDSAGVQFAGGKATYNWTLDQPMCTYLAAIAAAEYEVLHDSTDSRIFYYVYEWDVEDALASFVNVDLMMAHFESVYVPYPWDCKFSYVETPKGDMEHLSQVYHIASAINGSTYYDWLLAHEMSHMWWGDCVTETEWSDVWLSEGFATYSEAIWAEYYGAAEYDDYMVNDIMIPYLNSGETFPLSSPSTPSQYWSYTTYQKGASVLHMLRYVLGDTDFFDCLDSYFAAYAYSNTTTDQLRDVIESVTGGDIDWFFDTWVHGEGYPIYEIDTNWQPSGSNWEVSITLGQVQIIGPFFEMPVEFLIEGVSEDTLVTMWHDIQSQNELYTVSFEPVSITFDPYHHILSTALMGVEDQPLPPAGGTETFYLIPNPCRLSTTVSWPGMEQSDLKVTVFDIAGRIVRTTSLEAGDRYLDVSDLPSATYLVELRGEGNLRQVSRMVILD